MPGFSYRRVQWGPPPYLAPTAPASFHTVSRTHRYVKNHTPSRLGFIRGASTTTDTEAFIPYYLTHLKTRRSDVFPIAPPPIPSVQHLPYLYARLTHAYKITRARFFKLPKLEDPGPPATTRPIKFLSHVGGFRRANAGASYQFGILGGDAVGIPPERPKFGFLSGLSRRRKTRKAFSFRFWFPKLIVVAPTDRIPTKLVGIPKSHRVHRASSFLKYTPKFVPVVIDKLSLIEFFNLRIRLDVKKAVDSGVIEAVSTDVGGTLVNFNRAFKDIDSIVTTVRETTQFTTTVDFVDAPNPTSFTVFAYDTSGARVTKTVYWVARGII